MSPRESSPAASRGRWPAAGRLLVTAVIAAAAVLSARRLALDEDVARLLPDSRSKLAAGLSTAERLLDRMVIDVTARPGARTGIADLARAADRLAAELLSSGFFREVDARLEAAKFLALTELLQQRCSRLLDPESLRSLEETLQPEAVRKAVSRLARRLQEPDGAVGAARAARDPLGISTRALAPLARLAAGFEGTRIAEGRIVSSDGRHLLVLARPDFPPSDTARSEKMLKLVDGVIARLVTDPALSGIEVRYLGAHRSTLDNARQIQRDVQRTSILGVFLIGLVVVLSFSRLRTALLSFTPALFGGVLAAGVLSLFQDSISALVAGFGAVLLGLTVDYALHVLIRLDRSGESFRLPLHPLLVSATTTIAALLALQLSSLPAVRDIGLFSALGIAGALFFTVTALPVIAGKPGATRAPLLDPGRAVRWLQTGRTRRFTLAGGVLLTGFLAAGVFRLTFEGDVQKLSSLSPATRSDEAAIAAAWGEIFQVSTLVVRARTLQGALEANDRLARLLNRLQSQGAIRDHGSCAGMLPSRKTQEARLQAWRTFWSGERLQGLAWSLEQATRGTPFRADAFEPFIAWVRGDPQPLDLEDFKARGLDVLLEDRIFQDRGEWLASTPVFTDDFSQVKGLREAIRGEMPGAYLLNKQALVQDVSRVVKDEMGKLGGAAFLAVFLLVLAWHGRLVLGLLIVLPLAISLVWALGILGWIGVPINLTNAIFVAFLFGAAVDYAVFVAASRLERLRTGRDRTVESDTSVCLCAITTGIGFGALALAGHPVLFSVGVTGCAGILSCMLVTMIFLPPLVDGLLLRSGPNGTPGLRNLYAGAWVLVLAAYRIALYIVRRPFLAPQRREEVAREGLRSFSRSVRDRLPVGRRVQVGKEPSATDGPYVVVSNHESMYDDFAILAWPLPVRILVKKWVWEHPIVGRVARAAGFIPAAGRDFESMVREVRESRDAGISVLVFPEGTRKEGRALGRFHVGAFALARRLGVPVLPVACANSWAVFQRGGWWVGDHEVRVAILDAVDPRDFDGEVADRAMSLAVRDRICKARDEQILAARSADEWLRIVGGLYRYQGPVVGHYAASKAYRDPLVRALPGLCPGEDGVLVVGCGYGIMTARLALAFPERRIRAVEMDGRKLQVARSALRGLPGLSFVEDDIRQVETNAGEERFGTALLVDVLHYWPPEVQRAILERVAGALPRGGRLIFRDGCAGGGTKHLLVHAGEALAGAIGFTRLHGKLHFRSEEGWRELLHEAGFSVEEIPAAGGSLSNQVLCCRKEKVPGT